MSEPQKQRLGDQINSFAVHQIKCARAYICQTVYFGDFPSTLGCRWHFSWNCIWRQLLLRLTSDPKMDGNSRIGCVISTSSRYQDFTSRNQSVKPISYTSRASVNSLLANECFVFWKCTAVIPIGQVLTLLPQMDAVAQYSVTLCCNNCNCKFI